MPRTSSRRSRGANWARCRCARSSPRCCTRRSSSAAPTDEERIAEIAGIVEEETPFDLDWELVPNGLRQLGSVVAVTYDAPPLLAAVQRAVERRLVAEGLAEDERRRWLPHVTIARGRRGARFRAPPGAPPPIVLRGDAVVVYESLLRPTGATYVALGASPRRVYRRRCRVATAESSRSRCGSSCCSVATGANGSPVARQHVVGR